MTRLLRLLLYLCLLIGLGFIAASLYSPMRPLPPPPPLTGQVDHIVIEKAARRMQLFQGGEPVRTYRIALGFTPDGDKERQGDGKTPEGEFTVDRRNSESAFHLSIGLDYPRPADVRQASMGGYSPGGDIFIHGQPNALPDGLKIKGDWTAGCIAVTNAEIREIWAVTPVGTKVVIRP
ncbi:murein L,D-transpeptidase family protein [Tabrizicola sp.]|uniref:L,D-transpeptidase family protein n=1 Tax=Tabrizicola sp. TaxID=2005166 RepID=UPI0027342949|nr:L,D-transpeptidase [Tabrizicola sp.]MDP3197585.1 L,D-transpeptidase [Tabrizicola sp.]